MHMRMMKLCKVMLIGLAAGMAVGAAGICYIKSHKKGLKRSVGKALRSVGDLVDQMGDMF